MAFEGPALVSTVTLVKGTFINIDDGQASVEELNVMGGGYLPLELR